MRSLDPGGDEFLYLLQQALPKDPLPTFMMGILEDAIREASLKKKPLLIYIHDIVKDKKVAEKFLKNTIASQQALPILVITLSILG